MKGIGKLMGIYCYFFGIMSIIAGIYYYNKTGNIYIDFSFIGLFILGHYLYNHNSKARKITIIFSKFMSIFFLFMFLYGAIYGYADNGDWKLCGIPIHEGKNVTTLSLMLTFITLVPFTLLRTTKAQEEFENH